MSAKIYSTQKRLLATVLILLIAVAGCAVSSRQDSGVDWIVPGEHQIVFSAAGFRDPKPIRVIYTDVWQTEEYVLYKADGRQLEMIFAQASKSFTVALNYQMPIETMVATWNRNSQHTIVWGPLGRIDNRLGTWFYRTYEHSGRQRSCVGFLVEWDEIYEDPQRRPGKVLFGYYCAAAGEALADKAVRALIGGIRIRTQGGISEHGYAAPDTSNDQHPRPALNADSQSPSAIATVRGEGSRVDSGNHRFPFKFAHYYSIGGGRKMH
jgi:hypothetical protein